MTHLLLLGVSHHTAPVELRERLDFGRRGVPDALADLVSRPELGEAVILSTCNRAEVYVTCSDTLSAGSHLAEFMSRYHQVAAEELAPHFYHRIGGEVARHLYRVAAGLDSLVVGEPQILGQVKDAHAQASDQHCTGAVLNRLFHSSFGVGKRVRSETGLAEGAVSVSYAAVSLARKIFGDLRPLKVLLLGAGDMGKLTAVHLKAQAVREIAVASRTTAHAAALAGEIGGRVVPWTDLAAALADADIVVTAATTSEPLVDRRTVGGTLTGRRSRPLFIIDIAVPRNVDAGVGELEQVFLYDIDDLQGIVRDNLARRSAEIARAEAIVDEEVSAFETWLASRRAIPTVVALRQRFEEIRRAELERLAPKLAGLPPEARARIEEITRLIVEKLLLTPTEELKALPDRETVLAYSDALSRLFSLDSPDADLAGAGRPGAPPLRRRRDRS